MKYAATLRKLFKGITLQVEDLLLLESFQIKYLPDRVPRKEFSILLKEYPFIQRFLISKDPSIEPFLIEIQDETKVIKSKKLIAQYCNELLWEIADQIIYNKYPEVFDKNAEFPWNIDEIASNESLVGKVVADVGAGSGRLAFLLAKFAEVVYAIEPNTSFRNFLRAKATRDEHKNVYIMDGFLDSIPLPENSLDILFTSNAIGWNLDSELPEIERVVKPDGQAIHIVRSMDKETENTFHDILISSKWKYKCTSYPFAKGIKKRYLKTILKKM